MVVSFHKLGLIIGDVAMELDSLVLLGDDMVSRIAEANWQ